MSIPCHRSVLAYQWRIQLRGISPPVWRRILIPMASTILDLHEAIQATLGCEDIHLNRFTIRGQHYGVAHDGGMSFSTRPDQLQLVDYDF